MDLILDPIGGPTRLASFEALAPLGRVALYGESARPPPDLHLPVWTNNHALTGYSIGDLSRRAPETLRRHALAALGLVASGAVRIDITAEYDLAEAPEAQRLLEAGENTGKAVLRVRR
ncbi:Putative quinone oxidoreductase [Streptomyces microflavus DSM 40593]|uniref:Quinone oxidoreductase n=1 Tax=Streptomyces microflavus DSM 40593 TaxID=1303692 RepID=N0CXT8_STRMI|nr:Putative quinone oxidoreductase [Streptomyces microflavus DSM 40593]